MWIRKKKYDYIIAQIENCKKTIRKQEERTDEKIRVIAKRILEQPEELLEEIKGIEDIEQMINDFIQH